MGEPLYYATGRKVFRRPVTRLSPTGARAISVGFPVCILTEFVDEDAAQFIADALNKHDDEAQS